MASVNINGITLNRDGFTYPDGKEVGILYYGSSIDLLPMYHAIASVGVIFLMIGLALLPAPASFANLATKVSLLVVGPSLILISFFGANISAYVDSEKSAKKVIEFFKEQLKTPDGEFKPTEENYPLSEVSKEFNIGNASGLRYSCDKQGGGTGYTVMLNKI